MVLCVYVHTNPATHVGTITDWIGGSQQNSLCIFNPLGYREGGCWLGHLFLFPNGEHGHGSYQYPGVSPEILRPGYK